MRRLPASAVVLSLLLTLTFAPDGRAGEPTKIPSSRPRRPSDEPKAPAPFLPEFLQHPRPIVPLATGPAGEIGSAVLPANQSETSMASAGSQVVVGYNDS